MTLKTMHDIYNCSLLKTVIYYLDVLSAESISSSNDILSYMSNVAHVAHTAGIQQTVPQYSAVQHGSSSIFILHQSDKPPKSQTRISIVSMSTTSLIDTAFHLSPVVLS